MHYRRVLRTGAPGEPETRRLTPKNGQKECRVCGVVRPLSEYPIKSDGRRYHFCNTCKPNQTRRANVKRKFNLTLEQYDEIRSNGCYVCGSTYRLAIDHNHSCCPGSNSCGKCIRGVLCMRHNVALGQVADSVDELRKLIEYLEEN